MIKDYKKIHTSINSVNFIELARSSSNIYKTVAILGARSNQISSKIKTELNSRLAEFTPISDNMEEVLENREQVEIARSFESLPKPTLVALNEYFKGDLYYKDNGENTF